MSRLVAPIRLLVLGVSVAGLGCGGAADLHPVEGTFLVDGRPAANVMVAFHRAEPGDRPVPVPVGVTGPDGTFRLRTHRPDDGAPVGDYVVTAVWPDRTLPLDECVEAGAHDRFEGRYADPAKSPWHVRVRPGENVKTFRADLPTTGWSMPRRREVEPPREE